MSTQEKRVRKSPPAKMSKRAQKQNKKNKTNFFFLMTGVYIYIYIVLVNYSLPSFSAYKFSITSEYIFNTICLRSLSVGPSSPLAKLKSIGRIANFCTLAALLVEYKLALLIP